MRICNFTLPPVLCLLAFVGPLMSQPEVQNSRGKSSSLVWADSLLFYASHPETPGLKSVFEQARQSFSGINPIDQKTGDNVLDFVLRSDSILEDHKLVFLDWNRLFFTDDQLGTIKQWFLEGHLEPSMQLFYLRISLFRVNEFEGTLNANLKTPNLLEVLKKELSPFVPRRYLVELKSMATLANLGYSHYEDTLLHIVHELYKVAATCPAACNALENFYSNILPSTVGLLHSRRAVVETIYLMDEKRNSVFYGYDDVAWTSLPETYFNDSIKGKLSNGAKNRYRTLLWFFEDENIPQIKEILLHDPDIWLPHIR